MKKREKRELEPIARQLGGLLERKEDLARRDTNGGKLREAAARGGQMRSVTRGRNSN